MMLITRTSVLCVSHDVHHLRGVKIFQGEAGTKKCDLHFNVLDFYFILLLYYELVMY